MADATTSLAVDDCDRHLPQQPQPLTSPEPLVSFTPEELELFLLSTAPPPADDLNAYVLDVPPPKSEPSQSDEDMSAAAKRTRRTEIERLSRRRRQASLRSMRDEVKVLENQFAKLLASHAARKREDGWLQSLPMAVPEEDIHVPVSIKVEQGSDSDVKFSEQLQQLRERFIELKLLEKDLENEQKNLHRMLRGRELLSMSIQSLAFTFVREWSDTDHMPRVPELMDFTPAPVEVYFSTMREAYAELTEMDASTEFESSGSNCMGWDDRRYVDDKKMVFSMSKTIPGRDPASIMQNTWDVLSNESKLRESFGAWGTTMEMRVLDQPNKDLMVLYRTNTRRQCQNKRFHIIYLLFRVEVDDGYTICMRSVRSLETPLKGPGKWTGIFTWIHFRQSTNGCEIVYNNYIPIHPVRRRPVAEMFIAFVATVIRWESACVAPRLLL